MKRFLFSLIAIAFMSVLDMNAQQQPSLVWEQPITFSGLEGNPTNVVANASGALFVNGYAGNQTTLKAVVKNFSASGQPAWTLFDSTESTMSFMGHIAPLGNDVAWFSGVTPNYTTSTISRIDAAGNLRWRLPVGDLTYLGGRDDTSFVAIPVGTNPIAFVYNSNGVVIRQFPLAGIYRSITTVRARGDDLWVFAHYPGGTVASTSYFVVRYRISTGLLVWRKDFVDIIRGFGDTDADGNAYIAGSKVVNSPGGLLKFTIARVGSDGSLAWQQEYFTKAAPAANTNNWVNSCAFVQAGNSGQVILVGAVERSDTSNTGRQYAYAASFRASNGEEVWKIEKRIGTFNQFNGCTSLPGGAFLLVENTASGSGSVGYLSKYLAPTLSVKEVPGLPESFQLAQNYPNPFNPTTVIGFELMGSGYTSLMVYNMLGERVATLVDEKLNIGKYEASWNAAGMPSGTYFYRLTTNGFVQTKKMVLLK